MSLLPNPGCWFEIPVSDMRRATEFYEEAFGVKLAPMTIDAHTFAFFPMERDKYGCGGTLISSPPITPTHQGTTIYLQVDSIDPTLESISEAGGKTLFPRRDIGQFGFIAQFEDSEGNRIGLHENAKG